MTVAKQCIHIAYPGLHVLMIPKRNTFVKVFTVHILVFEARADSFHISYCLDVSSSPRKYLDFQRFKEIKCCPLRCLL